MREFPIDTVSYHEHALFTLSYSISTLLQCRCLVIGSSPFSLLCLRTWRLMIELIRDAAVRRQLSSVACSGFNLFRLAFTWSIGFPLALAYSTGSCVGLFEEVNVTLVIRSCQWAPGIASSDTIASLILDHAVGPILVALLRLLYEKT